MAAWHLILVLHLSWEVYLCLGSNVVVWPKSEHVKAITEMDEPSVLGLDLGDGTVHCSLLTTPTGPYYEQAFDLSGVSDGIYPILTSCGSDNTLSGLYVQVQSDLTSVSVEEGEDTTELSLEGDIQVGDAISVIPWLGDCESGVGLRQGARAYVGSDMKVSLPKDLIKAQLGYEGKICYCAQTECFEDSDGKETGISVHFRLPAPLVVATDSETTIQLVPSLYPLESSPENDILDDRTLHYLDENAVCSAQLEADFDSDDGTRPWEEVVLANPPDANTIGLCISVDEKSSVAVELLTASDGLLALGVGDSDVHVLPATSVTVWKRPETTADDETYAVVPYWVDCTRSEDVEANGSLSSTSNGNGQLEFELGKLKGHTLAKVCFCSDQMCSSTYETAADPIQLVTPLIVVPASSGTTIFLETTNLGIGDTVKLVNIDDGCNEDEDIVSYQVNTIPNPFFEIDLSGFEDEPRHVRSLCSCSDSVCEETGVHLVVQSDVLAITHSGVSISSAPVSDLELGVTIGDSSSVDHLSFVPVTYDCSTSAHGGHGIQVEIEDLEFSVDFTEASAGEYRVCYCIGACENDGDGWDSGLTLVLHTIVTGISIGGGEVQTRASLPANPFVLIELVGHSAYLRHEYAFALDGQETCNGDQFSLGSTTIDELGGQVWNLEDAEVGTKLRLCYAASGFRKSGFDTGVVVSITEPVWKLTSATPNGGPVNGGTPVSVFGTDFYVSDNIACTFGTTGVTATYTSTTSLSCLTPQHVRGSVALVVIEGSFRSPSLDFTFYEAPKITMVTPPLVRRSGITEISIYGEGFLDHGFTCLLESTRIEGMVVSETLGTCEVSATPEDEFSMALAISNNGVEFTASTEIDAYDELSVATVFPTDAVGLGGARVTVTGSDFVNTEYFECTFGSTSSVETFVKSSTIAVCTIPSLSAGGYVLAVSNNGQNFVDSGLELTIVDAEPELTTWTSTSLSIASGSYDYSLSVSGSDLSEDIEILLVHESYGSNKCDGSLVSSVTVVDDNKRDRGVVTFDFEDAGIYHGCWKVSDTNAWTMHEALSVFVEEMYIDGCSPALFARFRLYTIAVVGTSLQSDVIFTFGEGDTCDALYSDEVEHLAVDSSQGEKGVVELLTPNEAGGYAICYTRPSMKEYASCGLAVVGTPFVGGVWATIPFSDTISTVHVVGEYLHPDIFVGYSDPSSDNHCIYDSGSGLSSISSDLTRGSVNVTLPKLQGQYTVCAVSEHETFHLNHTWTIATPQISFEPRYVDWTTESRNFTVLGSDLGDVDIMVGLANTSTPCTALTASQLTPLPSKENATATSIELYLPNQLPAYHFCARLRGDITTLGTILRLARVSLNGVYPRSVSKDEMENGVEIVLQGEHLDSLDFVALHKAPPTNFSCLQESVRLPVSNLNNNTATVYIHTELEPGSYLLCRDTEPLWNSHVCFGLDHEDMSPYGEPGLVLSLLPPGFNSLVPSMAYGPYVPEGSSVQISLSPGAALPSHPVSMPFSARSASGEHESELLGLVIFDNCTLSYNITLQLPNNPVVEDAHEIWFGPTTSSDETYSDLIAHIVSFGWVYSLLEDFDELDGIQQDTTALDPVNFFVENPVVKEGTDLLSIYFRHREPPVGEKRLVPYVSHPDELGIVLNRTYYIDRTNWDDLHVLTFAVEVDNVVDGPQEIEVGLLDSSGLPPFISEGSLTLIVEDIDIAGVRFDAPQSTVVDELGLAVPVHVTLLSRPAYDVAVTLATNDTTEGFVKPGELIFNSTNWDFAQVAWVFGVPDKDNRDWNTSFALTVAEVSSNDQNYDGDALTMRPGLVLTNRNIVTPQVLLLEPGWCSMIGCNISIILADVLFPFKIALNNSAVVDLPIMMDEAAFLNTHSLTFETPSFNQSGWVNIVVSSSNGVSVKVHRALYVSPDCPEMGWYGEGLSCRPCPKHATCLGGTRVSVDPGYYWVSSDVKVIRCEDPPSRCLGTEFNLCSRGYDGFACSNCQDNYFRQNGACVACRQDTDSGEAWVTLIVGVTFLFGLSTASLYLSVPIFDLLLWVFGTLQQLATIGMMTRTQVASSIHGMYDILSLFLLDFDFIRPGCNVGRIPFWQLWLSTMLVSCFLPIIPIATHALWTRKVRPVLRRLRGQNAAAVAPMTAVAIDTTHSVVVTSFEPEQCCCKSSLEEMSSEDDFGLRVLFSESDIEAECDNIEPLPLAEGKDAYSFRAAASVLFFSLPITLTRCFQAVNCSEWAGIWVLTIEKTSVCFDAGHSFMLIVSVILICAVVGITCQATYVSLRKPEWLQEDKVASRLDFLYGDYKPEQVHYAVLDLVQLVAISAAVGLLQQEIDKQSFLVLFVLGFQLIVVVNSHVMKDAVLTMIFVMKMVVGMWAVIYNYVAADGAVAGVALLVPVILYILLLCIFFGREVYGVVGIKKA